MATRAVGMSGGEPRRRAGERGRILYLSMDGVLEPLGRSQIIAYLRGLAKLGFAYTLVSLERPPALADADRVAATCRELEALNVRWIYGRYRWGGGLLRVAANWSNMLRLALGAARRARPRERPNLIHARAHVAGSVALVVHKITGTPFLFDMRSYWVDEQAHAGRWFSNRFAYRFGKWVERKTLRAASGVVTLNQVIATDLRSNNLRDDDLRSEVARAGALHDQPAKPIVVIPTCADYDLFSPDRPANGAVPPEILERLRGKLVIGWLGAINKNYYPAESLTLFRYLLELRPDAHLLCLTQQQDEMRRLLADQGLAENAAHAVSTVAAARHEDAGEWLRLMHWGLLLLVETFSSRGAMPTKLAEFLAMGVRPIVHGCNQEVRERIQAAGSGLVLAGLSEADLRAAARQIAQTPLDEHITRAARNATRSYFSLEAGVASYESLLLQLIPGEARSTEAGG